MPSCPRLARASTPLERRPRRGWPDLSPAMTLLGGCALALQLNQRQTEARREILSRRVHPWRKPGRRAVMDERQAVRTNVPARLDRLPWSPFHRLVIAALGITWILDGLEVTLAGSVAAALQESPRLHLSAQQVGLTGSAYLAGAVIGALYFGHLTDKLGRKRLFNVTLGLYLVATAATAFSWDFTSFAAFRFLTGAGIGGEYAAINSAIQELIPARLRGRIDLAVNGSFWVGAAVGAAGSVWLLDPNLLPPDLGWRIAFGTGAVLGLFILYLRRFLPESPRWLMTHGRIAEAETTIGEIEARIT